MKLLADAASDNDPFRVWLHAWTGLEMLIAKRFDFYEKRRRAAAQPVSGNSTSPGPKTVQQNPLLLAKFRVISEFLRRASADADVALAATLKRTRDRVIHRGGRIPDDLAFQGEQIRALLRTYLELDLKQ